MNFIIASFLLLSLVSFGEPRVPTEEWTPDCSSDSDCTKWAVEAGKVDSDYCCAKQKCGDSLGSYSIRKPLPPTQFFGVQGLYKFMD